MSRTDLLGVLALCVDDTAMNPAIARCTDRLRRFAPAWLRQHRDDSYGFAPENQAYFDAQETPAQPAGMMHPPPELLAAFPDRALVEKVARAHGWPYLTHDSCLGGTRLFVLVPDPDDRFDQWWILDGAPAASTIADHTILSFLTVQKRDASGAQLPAVRVHFRDYQGVAATPSWTLALDAHSGGKCYACHGNGVRQLLPGRGQFTSSAPVAGEPDDGEPTSDVGLARLAAFNAHLASYGAPDWTGSINPDDLGPALGEAQGCTTCHNGSVRGALTVFTSEGMLWQKVIGQLSMRSPAASVSVPDVVAMALLEREATGQPPLSPSEKDALAQARSEHEADYQALVASRWPTLQAWLLGDRCD